MAIVLENGGKLGNTVLEGQVVVLDIDGMTQSAPTARRDWFKIDLKTALPSNGAPSKTDIAWLDDAKFYVLCVLPEGTLKDVEPEPAP